MGATSGDFMSRIIFFLHPDPWKILFARVQSGPSCVMQAHQRVAIMGVTGFVGHGLPALFAEKGIAVTGVSRSGKNQLPGVDRWQTPENLDFSGHTAVINLAGEAIDRRWTAKSKRLFHESRVGATTRVVSAIAKLPEGDRPKVLVNASAIGIYGDRGDEILNDNAPRGSGYLADLCNDWEDVAHDAESLGVRVVCLRIGVSLGKTGLLSRNSAPFSKPASAVGSAPARNGCHGFMSPISAPPSSTRCFRKN